MTTTMESKRSTFFKEGAEGEYVLSFKDVVLFLLRRVWLIVIIAIALTGITVGYTLMQTPVYQAQTKLLVGQEAGAVNTPQANVWGPDLLNQLIETLVEGVRSRPLAEEALNELDWQMDPDGFVENLSAQHVGKTQFITIIYTDPSPERAQQAANAVGDVFPRWVSEINPSSINIYATVVEEAETPQTPIRPNPVRNGFIALALGLMLGVGVAILLEYFGYGRRLPGKGT